MSLLAVLAVWAYPVALLSELAELNGPEVACPLLVLRVVVLRAVLVVVLVLLLALLTFKVDKLQMLLQYLLLLILEMRLLKLLPIVVFPGKPPLLVVSPEVVVHWRWFGLLVHLHFVLWFRDGANFLVLLLHRRGGSLLVVIIG